MDPNDKLPPQPAGEPGPADAPAMGMTRSSLLARAGVVAAGGAALAASPLGLGRARPRVALGQNGEPADDEIAPAPPSIGADIPVTYFGPSPSQVKRELVGPLQLLRSGVLDLDEGTITLPLYKGRVGSQTVWFVLTDTSDVNNADALGLLPAFKLEYADTGRGVRSGTIQKDGSVVFNRGTVNFSPQRQVEPGAEPNPFPPSSFQPGSVGDRNYSPLVRLTNAGGFVYNAPIVANGEQAEFTKGSVDYSRVHDKVVAISTKEQTVTLALTPGFSFAKPVLYLSLDASHELPASLEGATFAPALQDIAVGRDDSFASGIERIFAVTNGPRGKENPQRQGFNSAVAGEGNGPLNTLGGIPTVALDYSPLWDLNVGTWTQEAIDKGFRSRMIDEFQFLGMVQRGFITGSEGGGLSSQFIVNCPVVHRFL